MNFPTSLVGMAVIMSCVSFGFGHNGFGQAKKKMDDAAFLEFAAASKNPGDFGTALDSLLVKNTKSLAEARGVGGVLACWMEEYGLAKVTEPGFIEGNFKDGEKCYEGMKKVVKEESERH